MTSRIDTAAAERAVSALLSALGQDVGAHRFRRVPAELVSGLEKLLGGTQPEVMLYANDRVSNELTICAISYLSLCPHLSPIAGTVRFGYLPGAILVGADELEEVVAYIAHQPQLPAELAGRIADWVDDRLQPQGCAVLLEARSSCLAGCAGPAHQAREISLATRGSLRDDPFCRLDSFAHWPTRSAD